MITQVYAKFEIIGVMKFFRSYFMFFLLPAVIMATTWSCSSDDSNGESTEFNFLVLDVDTGEPIQGALIEICNSPYSCSNILASETTGVNGKIKLTGI